MNRCRRCILPDSRPDTHFEDGVCSACRAYDRRKEIDWQARRRELLQILEAYHGRCIVPSSGGKDSHYQVLTLLELGARPTVVTATTCHLTPIGRANIDNLSRYASTIEITPNRTIRAKLNRLGLQLVGDISWPEHASIFSLPLQTACQLGIPLVFYGECPQNQYGGPPGSEEARAMTRRWITEFGGFLGLRAADLIGREGITDDDMADYQPPSQTQLDSAGVTAYFLGQFLPWDSHDNAAQARRAGMRASRPTLANLWEAENLDNAQTGLHDYMMFLKYGYGRGAAQASVDIRSGLISRDAALAWAKDHDGAFPYQYAGVRLEDVLERIGLTQETLHPILDQFTNWSLMEHARDGTVRLKA